MARRGVREAFSSAFRGGAACAFMITSAGIASLWAILLLSLKVFDRDWQSGYSSVAAFGLGASSVALFARVGGGIFTKAADVGAGEERQTDADRIIYSRSTACLPA
jgi:Na+/H+-translocating membrane pyrophosphatase